MNVILDVSPGTINTVMRKKQADLDERATNALLRKIDLRLMPLLTILFFCSYLDRVNIGNKRISIWMM